MKKTILSLALLCSIIAPSNLFAEIDQNDCCIQCCKDCCGNYYNDCCCDEKGITFQTFDINGFLVENAPHVMENADFILEYEKGIYLHIAFPYCIEKQAGEQALTYKEAQDTIAIHIGDQFEVIYKKGKIDITDDIIFSIKDEDGNIIKPSEVIIKNNDICIGEVLLCDIDDIDVTIKGRNIQGVGDIGVVIPEILVDNLPREVIDTFFYKLIHEKLSDAIKYLEEVGFDLKPLLIAVLTQE